jgi:hypothetical protein
MKMEAAGYCETLLAIYMTTRCRNPEHRNLWIYAIRANDRANRDQSTRFNTCARPGRQYFNNSREIKEEKECEM